MLEKLSLFQLNNSGGINVKIDRCVLEKKSSFKMLGLPLLHWIEGLYIVTIVKTVSKKIGAFIG